MRMIPGAEVRRVIAAHMLGDIDLDATLGDVTLHEHQREGASRVRHLLDAFGGALVADDVGLGKTFLALAVARHAESPIVIAPAALRTTWEDAARATQVAVRFMSLESLARGASVAESPDLVVIDEAQHLRNSNTSGFAACRSICAGSKVLLLSATPIQNRTADLRVILSLFLGERAQALSVDALASFIVRREAADLPASAGISLPSAEPPQWLHPEEDADCLDRILALPPPLTAADAGDGGALLTYTLVLQWASSRAALKAALTRRIARACALEDSLADGRLPTRAELAAWTFSGGAQQLAFPLIAASSIPDDAQAMLARVRDHRDAVQALLAWIHASPDPDISRAARLRELAGRNPGRRIIAFSEYADTVAALHRLLSPALRVAMLTHAGGRMAAGRASRAELLRAFAPGAGAHTHERDRVDVLLTTDVLSEGVSLQDASIVVHLDLPWNPARMAQRVGRVRRIGSAEALVSVYAMAPPAPAARMLEIETRLRRKVTEASRAIGVAGAILPDISPGHNVSAATRNEQRAAIMRRWGGPGRPVLDGPVCGAVRAAHSGVLACVRVNGEVELVAIHDTVDDDTVRVNGLASIASGESIEVDIARRDAALVALNAWLLVRHATSVVDLPARRVAMSRRALLQRTDRIARAAPRHARASMSPLIYAARSAATAPLSAGAEQALEELTRADLPDEAWLRALGEFAALHARSQGAPGLIALLLLTGHH